MRKNLILALSMIESFKYDVIVPEKEIENSEERSRALVSNLGMEGISNGTGVSLAVAAGIILWLILTKGATLPVPVF